MIRNWAWLNGCWLDAATLAIPVWDAGFVFGATITDLCRTMGHRLFLWEEHLQRFLHSAQVCRLPIPYSPAELTSAANELVTRQTLELSSNEDLALVLFATPGPVPQYRPWAQGAEATALCESVPTVGMHTFRLPLARYARLWREGFSLVTVPVVQPPEQSIPREIKHRSRLHYWRAQRFAEEIQPGSVALLRDEDGSLLETAFANLVLGRRQTLSTPPLDHVLAGITLKFLAGLVPRLGWTMEYRPLSDRDVLTAEEAFVTSSSFCLLPVRQIDGKIFPTPGPMTLRLVELWNETIGFDLLAQLRRAESASSSVG